MPENMVNHSKAKLLLAFSALSLFLLFGCSINTSSDLQQEVRSFFYRNQTNSIPEKFVDWADNNLPEYSDRRIYDALLEEGKYHASIGHPNAISVISVAASDWASAKGLVYNEEDWLDLQGEAIENIRTDRGELEIWPD